MAFWSAFEVDPQQAAKACRSALNCQNAVATVNADPDFARIPRIELRVGIATGRAVVGDCGAPPALNDYTVIGDTVNLAARLESANKQFGTRILVNGRTQALLDDENVLIRPIGRIIVAGQTQPVSVYELLPPETSAELIELTELAVAAFADARFEEALRHLAALEERFGSSRLIEIYRRTIANVGDVFDGVLHLQEK
jgi:adenylate cyclase